MSASVVVRHLVIVGASCAIAACTLASGWSDLQGGRPPSDAGREGTTTPPGSSDDTATGDAAEGDGGFSRGVPCAGQTCTGTEGCCFANTTHCTTRQACKPSATSEYYECTKGSQCPSSARYCCFVLSTWSAQCQNSCIGTTDTLLCDPARSGECPADKQCLPSGGTSDIHVCQ